MVIGRQIMLRIIDVWTTLAGSSLACVSSSGLFDMSLNSKIFADSEHNASILPPLYSYHIRETS